MAIIKPEQLQSGSYSISGSFSGSFQGDGSQLNNVTASYLNPLTQDVTITGSLNLLSSSISVVDYIDFNNTGITPPPDIEGRIYWDEDNGTLSLGMHGGQVVQQVGLEEYFYVKNQTGDTIPNGSVVRAAGTLGASGRILGDLMIADGSVTYYFTLGIATEDIVDGDDGYVTQFGSVRGVNTTGTAVSESWNDGDVLWASPTVLGGLTKFEPDSPNLKIQMAIVIKAASNGTLFVRPDLSGFLTDLHNVNDFTTTSSFGDLLVKSGSTWTNTKQLTGSYGLTGSIEGGEFTGSFTGSFVGDGSGLTGVSDTNFANTDLTFTGNRSHDTNGNSLILRSSVAGANNFSFLGSGNGSTSRTYFEMGQQKNGGFSTSVFFSSFSPDYNDSLWGSFFAGSSMISTYHESPATTQGTGNLYFDLSHFTGTLTNKYFAWHAAPVLTARGLNTEMMRLHVLSDGNGYLGIGTQGVPQERLHVNGNAVITGSLNVTGGITGSYTGSFVGDGSQLTGIVSSSYALTASYAEVAGAGAGFPFSGSAVITGSLLISSSTNQQLTLIGSGSNQPIFTVQGSSGELFSITDNLSGSLFSVNNISGLPIFEVFSDDKIIQGDYTAPMLTTTVKNTVSSVGAFTVYELPTSSYDGAFFEYVAKSGSDARAGQIMSLWSGSQVNFTETTTTDFGNTSGLSFIVTVTGSNFALTGSVTTANWTIKTIVRSI